MTHLVIENQNSNTEIVSVAIILKIYEMALSAEGSMSLKGNLLSEHAKLGAYNYLTGNLTGTNTKRFPLLDINVTGGLYVDFADPVVELKLATKFGDGVGVTASAVTGNLNESWGFKNNTNITSFNELGLFTNVTKFTNGEYVFYNCSNLQSIDLRNITEIGSSDSLAFRNCTSLISVGNTSNLLIVGADAFRNCTSLTSIDLSNVTTIRSNAFLGCTSLTHVDLSSVTDIKSSAFLGCTSLGVGETMELTNNTNSMPANVFKNTKYVKLILHMPNITNWDVRYPIWEGANQLTYLDISDCAFTKCGQLYGNNLLVTYILPSGLTFMENGIVNGLSSLLHFIILAETPPSLDTTYDFNTSAPNANIYVKNSTVRDAYLADSNWGSIPNASTRIKTLAELPVGVWKTGLYQSYEPYLSNSSDPAYTTT